MNTHTASQLKPHDNKLFIAFLILIVWMPLPLGSNRLWALSILEVTVFALSISWIVLYAKGKTHFTTAFIAAKSVIILLGFAVFWTFIQQINLPISLVEFLSPNVVKSHLLSLSDPLALPDSYIPLSVDPHATYLASLEYLAYWLIFCLTLLLVNSRSRFRLLATVVVFSGLFQALYGSFMSLTNTEWGFFVVKEHYKGVATGTFINRNHLAGYLEMCLAIGIGLLLANLAKSEARNWREKARRTLRTMLGPKVRLRIYLAIMVIALVLTHSRMGNTAFFSSLIIAGMIGVLLTIGKRTNSERLSFQNRSKIILLSSLVIIDLSIVGAWFGVGKVVERIEQTSATIEKRDEVSNLTWNMFQDYWLTGTGGGSYYSIFNTYKEKEVDLFFNHAHNDYLEYAAEMGIIGFIPLSLAVLLSLYIALNVQRTRNSSLAQGMGFAATMGIISLLIHSAVDFNLQIPANASLFVILMGIAWAAKHTKNM